MEGELGGEDQAVQKREGMEVRVDVVLEGWAVMACGLVGLWVVGRDEMWRMSVGGGGM